MEIIFYTLSLFFIWVEIYQYNNFDKIFILDENGELEKMNKPKTIKDHIFSIGYIMYSIWSVIGMFTDNWVWFGVLIGLSTFSFLKKISPKMFVWYSLMDLITSIIVLCIILSKCFIFKG